MQFVLPILSSDLNRQKVFVVCHSQLIEIISHVNADGNLVESSSLLLCVFFFFFARSSLKFVQSSNVIDVLLLIISSFSFFFNTLKFFNGHVEFEEL